MYITDIFIEEFGGHTNKSISLGAGLNLLTGVNESGKSTLCAFIKYVFYGFSGSKEKERYSSLSTGRSAGALIIDRDGEVFRIERRDGGSVHYVAVYNESTSMEFTEWKKSAMSPGEYFLGVHQELYPRSVYVNQDEGARLDGGSAEAVSNLLLSGDEAVNLRRAQKSLDSARKTLKLKKGIGGLISQTESKLAELRALRATGVTLKASTAEYTVALKETERDIAELQSRIRTVKEAIDRVKCAKIRIYLTEVDKVDGDIACTKSQIDELKKRYTVNGYLPTDGFESKIISAERDIRTYLEQCSSLQTQLERIKTDFSAKPPKGYDAYCEMGKKNAILADYKRYQSSLGTFKIFIFAAIFVFLTSLVAIGATLIDLLESGPFLYVMLGTAAIVGIGATLLRYFPAKKIKKMSAALKADEKRTVETACGECAEYDNKLGVHSKSVTDAIAITRNKLNAKKTEEGLLLKKWGKNTAEQALGDYRSFNSQYAELRKSLDGLETRRSVLDAYLSGYSESEIAAARALDEKEPILKEMHGMTEEQFSELEVRLEAARERKNELELAIANAGANKVDIEALSAEIEENETRLEDYNRKYEALLLALDALDGAEKNVRQTVSPYLSKYAGEYFSAITDGRYSALRIDAEMNLSFIFRSGTSLIDSAYLSGGSAELAWLCLRLALHGRLSENGRIPLILDECFVYFDDERLEKILQLLTSLAQSGIQVLLFSASSREKDILGDNATVISL